MLVCSSFIPQAPFHIALARPIFIVLEVIINAYMYKLNLFSSLAFHCAATVWANDKQLTLQNVGGTLGKVTAEIIQAEA